MTALAHRKEIDGLRALAVLSVVFYHAVDMPRAGYVGVDVFFVISGYLITALLLREHAETGRIDLAAFYARRVRRIFPMAIFVIASVLAAGTLLLAPQDLLRVARSAAAAAVFAANIFFEATTGGYFDPDVAQMPLLHLWSLAVEEQFYLLWPAILWLLLGWQPRRLVPIMAVMGVASFAFAETMMRISPEAAFYQTPARFWELAAGGLVAAMPIRIRPVRWLPLLATCIVVTACFVPCARFPGLGALPAVAGTAALLWSVNQGNEFGFVGTLLRSPPMAGIGLVSYSLYLWHWPLLAFYRANSIGAGSIRIRIALCGVAMLLAFASYRYVETPFRRMSAKRLMLGAGIACSIVLAIAASGFALKLASDNAAIPRDNPLAVQAENDWPPHWKKCHYQVWSKEFPRAGCETIAGRKASVVLWGDSMALSWRPLIETMGEHAGQAAIDYSRDACPPLMGFLPSNPLPGDFNCRDWNAKVFDYAKGANVVVLVARWNQDFSASDGRGRIKALRTTLVALAPVVHRVIVIGATPELRDQVAHCVRMNAIAQCAVPRKSFDAVAGSVMLDLRGAAQGLPNIEFVDPTGFFCNAIDCPAIKNGVPLYVDSHHISYTAAKRYANEFTERK